ncbi:hypothetical protein ACJX0J_032841 [Zea mays]
MYVVAVDLLEIWNNQGVDAVEIIHRRDAVEIIHRRQTFTLLAIILVPTFIGAVSLTNFSHMVCQYSDVWSMFDHQLSKRQCSNFKHVLTTISIKQALLLKMEIRIKRPCYFSFFALRGSIVVLNTTPSYHLLFQKYRATSIEAWHAPLLSFLTLVLAESYLIEITTIFFILLFGFPFSFGGGGGEKERKKETLEIILISSYDAYHLMSIEECLIDPFFFVPFLYYIGSSSPGYTAILMPIISGIKQRDYCLKKKIILKGEGQILLYGLLQDSRNEA